MSEFVDECRREWRRLGVPDPIANEMAADLAADLAEADAEGGSVEDVVGTSAFDPRRFAASWAMARGVTSPPIKPPEPTWWRTPVAAVVLAAVVALGAGVVTVAAFVREHGSSARGPWNVLPGPGRAPSPWPSVGPLHDLFSGSALGPPLLLVGVLGVGAFVVVGLAVGLVTAHVLARAPRASTTPPARRWPGSRAGS